MTRKKDAMVCGPGRTESAVPELLTKKEAAQLLGTGVRGIEGLMKRRALPFHRISARCVRFSPAAIQEFLSRVEVKSPASVK